MIAKTFLSQSAWLEARVGKITGSLLNDIVVKRGTQQKNGYYNLIASRLALPPDAENVMDRGHRLEEEAIERFEKETGKTVDKSLILWMRDDNEDIAVSPDGVIGKTEAIEVKCLSSALHIKALLTGGILDEYKFQALQYFIVSDELETLHFCFYDPRLAVKDFFYYSLQREAFKEEIEKYHKYQTDMLAEINDLVNTLLF